MNMPPMVSVVIPAYNSEKYLKKTIDSALLQSFADVEILIIDDASSDNTFNLAQELSHQDQRVKVFRNEKNLGVAETRNKGFAIATGKYIALLDADDLWLRDKLERQLDYILKNKLDLCYTAYSFIDEKDKAIGKPYHVPEELTIKRLLCENVIGCSTSVFSRRVLEFAKMRPEYMHEDYVFWLELLQHNCKAGGIDEVLMNYRILATSRSANKMRAAAARWLIYRKFLKMNAIASGAVFARYAIKAAIKRLH